MLSIARNDGSDSPLKLSPFRWVVQSTHEFVPRAAVSWCQRIRQSPRDIVTLLHLRVAERKILVKRMGGVRNMIHVASELKPAGAAEVTHELRMNHALDLFAELILVAHNILVDESLYIVLVRRPQALLLVPDREEVSTLDHQILGSSDLEVRIYLNDSVSSLTFLDRVKIHLPSLPLLRGPCPRANMTTSDTRVRPSADPSLVHREGRALHVRPCRNVDPPQSPGWREYGD